MGIVRQKTQLLLQKRERDRKRTPKNCDVQLLYEEDVIECRNWVFFLNSLEDGEVDCWEFVPTRNLHEMAGFASFNPLLGEVIFRIGCHWVGWKGTFRTLKWSLSYLFDLSFSFELEGFLNGVHHETLGIPDLHSHAVHPPICSMESSGEYWTV